MATQIEISTIAAVREVRNLKQALTQLTQTLMATSRGVIRFEKSLRTSTTTMQRLTGAQRRVRTSMSGVRKEAKSAAVATGNMTDRMRNLGSSAIFAVGPLSGIGARINALGAIATRTGVRIALFAAGLVAVGVAAFKLVSAMLRTNLELFRIRSALRVATGSTAAAEVQFNKLKATSFELGISLKSAGLQFAQLAAAAKGTNLEGSETFRIFEAITGASVVLGLSAEQTTGALRAIQQMMSKGTVQAEELRGQLGERLPGAFQLAARAMGVTTQELGKMLEQGEVLADELLPKLATELEKTFGPQITRAAASLNATMGRLGTAITGLLDTMERRLALAKSFANAIDKLADAFKRLDDFLKPDLEGLRKDFEETMKSFEKAIKRLSGPLPKGFFGGLIPLPANELERIEKVRLDKVRSDFSALLRLLTEMENQGKDVADLFELLRTAAAPLVSRGLEGFDLPARVAPPIQGPPVRGDFIAKERKELTQLLETQEKLSRIRNLSKTTLAIESELIDIINDKLKDKEALNAQEIAELREIITARVLIENSIKSVLALQRETAKLAEKEAKALVKAQEKAEERVRTLEKETEVISLRLLGLKEEADLIKVRAEVEKDFGQALEVTKASIVDLIQLNAELEDELERQNDKMEEATEQAEKFARAITKGLDDAILKGKSFKEVLGGIAERLAALVLETAVTKPLGNILTGIIGGFTGGIGTAAHGGPINGPTLVGERGPEIFVPRGSGNVIPNNAIGKGGDTYIIDARGADRTGLKNLERVIRELNGSIEQRAVAAVQSSRTRSFSSASLR